MDEQMFWGIVQTAKDESGGDHDVRFRSIVRQLSDLPCSDIAGFQEVLWNCVNGAYSWDLWGAAYIINGGCSDDSFGDFRLWLVSMGEQGYRSAMSDPETVGDLQVGESDIFFEAMGGVADEAYGMSTGRYFDDDVLVPSQNETGEPAGVKW